MPVGTSGGRTIQARELTCCHTSACVCQKTASGIFLPGAADKTLPEATVIAVGPGARDINGKLLEVSVKAGDKVLLPGFGGQSVKVGDEEYHLFRDAEILAKIEG